MIGKVAPDSLIDTSTVRTLPLARQGKPTAALARKSKAKLVMPATSSLCVRFLLAIIKRPIMTKNVLVIVFIVSVACSGCGSPDVAQNNHKAAASENSPTDAQVATQTMSRMLELATEGDWDTYVDQYYGEPHKFRSPTDRDALVTRFQEKWGGRVVEGLERAANLPVQIVGDEAVFQDHDEAVFTLHRDENGTWKFHL